MLSSECLALLQGHTSLVGQLQLTDSVLVTGGSDGRVIVFSLATLECLHRLCAHDNSVTCLQFDDRFIVSGGNDGRVKLFDFKTGQHIMCAICSSSDFVSRQANLSASWQNLAKPFGASLSEMTNVSYCARGMARQCVHLCRSDYKL